MGKRKYTTKSCHELAAEKNGSFLSDKYINYRTKYSWQCHKGHIWETTFAHIKKGSWCPYCAGTIKKTVNDCMKLAEGRGGYFLSDKYINAMTKYLWKCGAGHTWEATYVGIYQGNWCPFCSVNIRKTIDHCKNLAMKRNGKYLSKKYINNKTKYLWECEKGHRWRTTLKKITNGHWCPICAGFNKVTVARCNELAKRMGGKFLSGSCDKSKTKYLWECKEGHNWQASHDNINNGKWCPKCAKRAPITMDDCKLAAKNRNGKFLSRETHKSISKYLWECEFGHQWKASYNKIKNGTWCPQCRWKTQPFIFKVIKDLFPNQIIGYNFRGFKWLGRQEIDIFVPDIKLAIEYDGEQHFYPVKFDQKITDKQAKQQFQAIQKRDQLKNEKIEAHPEDVKYFIRFNYKEKKLFTKEYITNKIKTVLNE